MYWLSLVVVGGLLIAAASLVAVHRFQGIQALPAATRGLRVWAQELRCSA